jgi:hypothetical protein
MHACQEHGTKEISMPYGILRASLKDLESILKLPEGYHIVSLLPYSDFQAVSILMESDDIPEPTNYGFLTMEEKRPMLGITYGYEVDPKCEHMRVTTQVHINK